MSMHGLLKAYIGLVSFFPLSCSDSALVTLFHFCVIPHFAMSSSIFDLRIRIVGAGK